MCQESVAMRAALGIILLTFASQAGAECGNLCVYTWMKSATEADLQAELSGGADVMARDELGWTPLHWAASSGTSDNIEVLLAVGADAKAKSTDGKTPWDLVQENEEAEGTKGYWALNDAQYN